MITTSQKYDIGNKIIKIIKTIVIFTKHKISNICRFRFVFFKSDFFLLINIKRKINRKAFKRMFTNYEIIFFLCKNKFVIISLPH